MCRKRSNCSAAISFQSSCFLTSERSVQVDQLLDALANPVLFFFALDVPVLDADLAAVGALQDAQISRSVALSVPPRPPVMNTRSRSQIVRP